MRHYNQAQPEQSFIFNRLVPGYCDPARDVAMSVGWAIEEQPPAIVKKICLEICGSGNIMMSRA
jgi:hypothetical protein